MRHVREILRLHHLNLSSRQIAISCRISKTTASNTIKRAQAAGITWPIPEHLDEYFAGVPEIVVPDNLKSGVKSPSYYEAEINRAYTEFAEHYGLAVIPARVRKPKDKAKEKCMCKLLNERFLHPCEIERFSV